MALCIQIHMWSILVLPVLMSFMLIGLRTRRLHALLFMRKRTFGCFLPAQQNVTPKCTQAQNTNGIHATEIHMDCQLENVLQQIWGSLTWTRQFFLFLVSLWAALNRVWAYQSPLIIRTERRAKLRSGPCFGLVWAGMRNRKRFRFISAAAARCRSGAPPPASGFGALAALGLLHLATCERLGFPLVVLLSNFFFFSGYFWPFLGWCTRSQAGTSFPVLGKRTPSIIRLR